MLDAFFHVCYLPKLHDINLFLPGLQGWRITKISSVAVSNQRSTQTWPPGDAEIPVSLLGSCLSRAQLLQADE